MKIEAGEDGTPSLALRAGFRGGDFLSRTWKRLIRGLEREARFYGAVAAIRSVPICRRRDIIDVASRCNAGLKPHE
jgi:hypothetical protein